MKGVRYLVGTGMILFFLAMTPVSGFSKKDASSNATKAFDFSKTRQLISEWTVRKKFPDELTISYYYTYIKLTLSDRVDPQVEKRILAFVRSCQKKDGGFASDPRYASFSSVKDTFYAYKTLKLLHKMDVVDWDKAAAFLRARMNSDGGFSNRPGDKKSNIVATCWAVQVLAGIGGLTDKDREIITAYIMEFRGKDGGFAMLRGKPSSPRVTGMAVSALQAMGGLDDKLKREVVTYLKTTRYSGLVKGKKYHTRPYVEGLYYVLEAMHRCGAVEQLGKKEILHFLYRLYVPFNGGFGPTPGLGTTPPSTYYALKSLALLGLLTDPEG